MIYLIIPLAWIICSLVAVIMVSRYYGQLTLEDLFRCLVLGPMAFGFYSNTLEDIVVWRKK